MRRLLPSGLVGDRQHGQPRAPAELAHVRADRPLGLEIEAGRRLVEDQEPRLVQEGARMLAVAYVEEAMVLRAAGVAVPIVVLSGFVLGILQNLLGF